VVDSFWRFGFFRFKYDLCVYEILGIVICRLIGEGRGSIRYVQYPLPFFFNLGDVTCLAQFLNTSRKEVNFHLFAFITVTFFLNIVSSI